MLTPTNRSRLPLLAAGLLVLVALATFLTLDLGGGSLSSSDLPVVRVGETDTDSTGTIDAAGESSEAGLGDSPGGDQVHGNGGGPSTGSGNASTSTTAATSTGESTSGSRNGNTGPGSSVHGGDASTTTSVETESPVAVDSAEDPAGGDDAAQTSTTTTVRETVTSGARVQNGPGAGQGAGAGDGSGEGPGGTTSPATSPGTTAGKR